MPIGTPRFLLRCALPAALFALLGLAGCGHLIPHEPREYVYVWARDTWLRDRVAAVSDRVAEVTNGQRLEVVEHGRRFLKVRTAQNQIGWIEEHFIIDQTVFDKFDQMARDSGHDPVIGTAVLRDDYWVRDAPGRTSDRFYLLPENDKLQLLMRASIPKPVPPPQPVPLPQHAGQKNVGRMKSPPAPPPPPELEDYWLVRDSAGHVGWIRGRTLEEDVPDAIAGLAEGQKIVGAYVLTTVNDPDANVSNNEVPEYVTAMAPWKDGLPYDFDQVRVFTWNTRKHRYETAYRERDIAGYLPMTVGRQTFDNQPEPVFSYRVAASDQPALDPVTGMVKPGSTLTESFRMEGVIVRRIGEAPPPSAEAQARRRDRTHKHNRG